MKAERTWRLLSLAAFLQRIAEFVSHVTAPFEFKYNMVRKRRCWTRQHKGGRRPLNSDEGLAGAFSHAIELSAWRHFAYS